MGTNAVMVVFDTGLQGVYSLAEIEELRTFALDNIKEKIKAFKQNSSDSGPSNKVYVYAQYKYDKDKNLRLVYLYNNGVCVEASRLYDVVSDPLDETISIEAINKDGRHFNCNNFSEDVR